MELHNASDLIRRDTFRIRSYEIDPWKCATPTALVRLMQEASMRHVIDLKLSVWDLEPQGLSWVLIRQRFQIHLPPLLGDSIEVLTHPSGFERVFTHRDFRMFDSHGQEIANASTTWLLLNTANRRMTRIPPFLLDYNDKLPPASGFLPRTPEEMPPWSSTNYSREFTVGWYDLDFNFHLTNTLYVAWLLETNDPSFLRDTQLQEMKLWYLAEGLPGDQLRAETQIMDDQNRLHRLVRPSDGKVLAFGATTWKQKSP